MVPVGKGNAFSCSSLVSVSRFPFNSTRSARRLEVGLANKKSVCTGNSGKAEKLSYTQSCHTKLSCKVVIQSCLETDQVWCCDRVVELALVESQVSLHEQSSLTPASGLQNKPKSLHASYTATKLRSFLVLKLAACV